MSVSKDIAEILATRILGLSRPNDFQVFHHEHSSELFCIIRLSDISFIE